MVDGFHYGRLEDVPNHIVDMTDDGMCTECGSCCGALLPVSRKELDRIVEYVERNGVKPYVDRGPWVQVEFDLTCPFLDRGKRRNKCRIYEVRPFICRVFNCHIEMNPLEAIKVRNHYADGDVDVVNMRELFGEG